MGVVVGERGIYIYEIISVFNVAFSTKKPQVKFTTQMNIFVCDFWQH